MPTLTLASGLVFMQLATLALLAQQPSPPRRGQLPVPVPIAPRVWRSETTGKEYRVWIENQRFHAEWVNVPPDLAQRGASIRTTCRLVGAIWIGTTRSYLPCEAVESSQRVRNWCRLLTKIEITDVKADRITGRGEGLRRFDCERCKILETVWADFEWVPRR